MVPKHNFIGPFKLFFFIGKINESPKNSENLNLKSFFDIFSGKI
jgi:hypothetical protein